MTLRPLYMLVTLTVISSIGCAGTSFIKSPGQFLPGARDKARGSQAARILCLWEAAEGQGLDGRPARGFAGQILFFGSADAEPMPVHGTVRIYEYENLDPDEINPRPIHVFAFEDSAWNVHRAESTFGEAYNVFLPYVKRHDGQASCALKVEFVPNDGRPISSPITEITLEPRQGRSAPQSALARNVIRKETTSPSGESSPPGPGTNIPRVEDKQLESLTIRLPRRAQ